MRAAACLALAIVVLLGACARRDGYFTIRGEILEPAPGRADCTVALPAFKDASNAADFTRKVQGHFQEAFAVPQRAAAYDVVVACEGYAPLTKNMPLPAGEFAIDLGNIMLTPTP
jgi:hypothetical protein